MTTIDELEARLAELEARAGVGVEPLAANPPITIGELADVPAPGSAILSAWTQEVSRRCLHRFASVAARDAAYPAAGAGAGAICYTSDTGTIWTVIGAAWVAAAPSARFGWSGARVGNQAIAHATLTAIIFDTEYADLGNYAAPMPTPTITIPAGLGGVYAGTLTYTFGAAITAASAYVQAGGRLVGRIPTDTAYGNGAVAFAGVPLNAGETVVANVYQASGAGRNLNASLDLYRTGT